VYGANENRKRYALLNEVTQKDPSNTTSKLKLLARNK